MVSSKERASRASWPVRVYRLGEEPCDDLKASTTAEERLAMVWELTLQAWELAGREFPAYDRGETPVQKTTLRALEEDERELVES